MGKEEGSVKKARKQSSAPETTKQVPSDVYKRVVEFEEAEAKIRSAEKDANLFKKMCQDIRQIFADIAELKLKDGDEVQEQITAKRIEASLILVALKKLNRLEKVRTRAGRDALHKEKQCVDSTHLLLQNLLYEADHLNKEVTKCLQFKSKDEEIELVSLEEFYKQAPSEISRSDITKKDEHQLQLARLEWELRQRRELAGTCNELLASKERVAAAIAAARSRLDALSPHLRDLLQATKPLQECLALRLDEKRDEARAAALLPLPLFLLHANSKAYAEAFGAKKVSVLISGDEDEAKRLYELNNLDDQLEISNDSDSDQDNNDEEVAEKKKRHHRSKVSKEDKAEAKKKEILKKHPLSVQLSVKIPDDVALNLIFYYLMHLKIIVVKFTVTLLRSVVGVSAADVLNGHNILYALYPGDSGNDSPHPATSFLLNMHGIQEEFQQFIPEIGRPYVWAQRMCGLDFMIALTNEDKRKMMSPCAKLSVVSVENVLINLRKRLRARVELMKELQDLESGKIAPFNGGSQYPVRLSGSLTQWQSISWAEYSQASSTAFLISEGLVNTNDMLYRAIITRQSAKLVALVALRSEYPKKAPIFSLTLHWNGTHHAGTDDDIRDIERVINTKWGSDGTETFTLTNQITKLLTCLDILLEATGSSEFPPDKVMFRPVRGRNRIKPYKYLKQGTGVFIQY
ncbi:THO complex subunit 5 homolog [Eumeta japonica]|uniref:THO complex subunit 5 homolog n=1 Tax=Eumeta variegata TaxID=151549 RepID=A0A4C1ZE40_EUMVA|nr:THO complex subunit 5 homolog [Eumeta japonica]